MKFDCLAPGIQTCSMNDIQILPEYVGMPMMDSFDEIVDCTDKKSDICASDICASEARGNAEILCETCKVAMQRSDGFALCEKCGLEIRALTDADCSLHYCPPNYSSEYTTLKLSGRGAYTFQRSIMKTCTTHQAPRRTNILRDMNRWNAECDKYHVPKNVIQQASDMFQSIRAAGYVYRGGSREGVMGNCIYYACYMNGITKTPTEIAQFTGIDEKFISQGSRILHRLHEQGVIQIPTVIDPISDYLDRFVDMLGVPRQYKKFLFEIVEEANVQKLHVIYDSKNLTKCAGALYLLADRVPWLRPRLTKEEIERVCQTSRTTFTKYTDMLVTHWKLFRAIYKRNHIPMRTAWALNPVHQANAAKIQNNVGRAKNKPRAVRKPRAA